MNLNIYQTSLPPSFLGDRVSSLLNNPSYIGAHFIDQAGLELKRSTCLLVLKACVINAQITGILFFNSKFHI